MNINAGNVSRKQYYDRNPSVVTENFNSTVAPHAFVARWSYTVPANTKFFMSSTLVEIQRITAAGTPGGALAEIDNATQIVKCRLTSAQNAIGDGDLQHETPSGVFPPGEVIAGNTADGSTTGTVFYLVSMSGVEFDA